MKVLIFGATGMIGQGALLECLRAQDVELVVTLGRTATGRHEGKLREIVHAHQPPGVLAGTSQGGKQNCDQ